MNVEVSCVYDDVDARHLGVDASELGADAVDDRHGVGSRLLLHLQLHRALAVDAHELPTLFGAVVHIRDVAHVHRHALARHDDQIPDVLDALELSLAADEERRVALVNLAQRCVLVLGTDRLDDLRDREIERLNLLLREIDVNLPAEPAANRHGGDAVHALEAGGDFVFREFAERDRVVFTLDAELDDCL